MDEVLEKLQTLTDREEYDEDVSKILDKFKSTISYEELIDIRKLIDAKLQISEESQSASSRE